jgi:hypothetical protein
VLCKLGVRSRHDVAQRLHAGDAGAALAMAVA